MRNVVKDASLDFLSYFVVVFDASWFEMELVDGALVVAKYLEVETTGYYSCNERLHESPRQ